jgi:hypothetical protein
VPLLIPSQQQMIDTLCSIIPDVFLQSAAPAAGSVKAPAFIQVVIFQIGIFEDLLLRLPRAF